MARCDFTAQAERDLENIADFTVSTWGAAQAEKYIAGLENLAQELANNPKMGIRCEHLANGLLSFPFTSHVLYYVGQAHGITIILDSAVEPYCDRLMHGTCVRKSKNYRSPYG